MLRIENLKLSPGGGSSALRNAVLHILRIPEKDLLALHILRRSIDAREGRKYRRWWWVRDLRACLPRWYWHEQAHGPFC